jgi:hypothetical protein
MGWSKEQTLSLTPKEVVLYQKALFELLNHENGNSDNTNKIKKAQETELANKIKGLRSKGVTTVSPDKFFGILAK